MNDTKQAPKRQWAHQRWALPVVIGYGALVLCALLYGLVTTVLANDDDPSFGLIVPMAGTFPLGTVLVVASVALVDSLHAYGAYGGGTLALVEMAVAGAVQAYGLWLLLRGRRVSTPETPQTPQTGQTPHTPQP
jgi:hypothetical protein